MANKITKAQMFGMIKAVAGVASNPDMVAFIDHEIELLSKRNSKAKKPTKKQTENIGIMDMIFDVLSASDIALSIADIRNTNSELEALSSQKVSALLKKMVDDGRIVKEYDKKVPMFSVPEDTEDMDDDEEEEA